MKTHVSIIAAVVSTCTFIPVASGEDFFQSPLLMGVYECYDQNANPTPEMMFGLIDEETYSNYDGYVGSYDYDPSTGIIEVGAETGAPARFVRISDRNFRALNEDGSLAGFVCPLNQAKDPSNPPW